jgi:hypothetical protein
MDLVKIRLHFPNEVVRILSKQINKQQMEAVAEKL